MDVEEEGVGEIAEVATRSAFKATGKKNDPGKQVPGKHASPLSPLGPNHPLRITIMLRATNRWMLNLDHVISMIDSTGTNDIILNAL